MSRDILDAIDLAIADWETSADAMRMNAPVSLEKRQRAPHQYAGSWITFSVACDTGHLVEALRSALRQISDAYARAGEALKRVGIITTDFSRATEPKDTHERWQRLLVAKHERTAPPGVDLVTQSRRR